MLSISARPAPAAITAPVAIGLAGAFLRLARDGTIDGTAAYFELLARSVIEPEPTAALAACHQCAFWDSVSPP